MGPVQDDENADDGDVDDDDVDDDDGDDDGGDDDDVGVLLPARASADRNRLKWSRKLHGWASRHLHPGENDDG